MGNLLERLDGLFSVEQKKNTYTRALLGVVFVILAVGILPMLFKYEDYAYGKYKDSYKLVEEYIINHKAKTGQFPLGDPIDWSKEGKLSRFFKENNLTIRGELYYVDLAWMQDQPDTKYTYLIDSGRGTLYTRESIVFKFRRWHFPFY